MSETWYVMADGTVGDPNEISLGADGRLRHRDGRAVAYGPHGPRSRGCVDAEAERAKVSAEAEAAAKAASKPAVKDMKPETTAPGYTTRESEAR